MKFTEPSLVGGLSRLRIKWDSQVQHAEATFKWKWEWVRGNPKQDGLFQIHIIWVFPKIVVPQNGWFMMENPIKMDDLRVPLFFGNTNLNRLVFPIYLLATGEGSLIPVDGSGIKLTSWGNGSLSHNLTGFYKFPGGWPWDLNHQQ